MAEHEPETQSEDKATSCQELETARVGYQVAVNLWMHQGRLFWTRFLTFAVANSAVLGVYGLAVRLEQVQSPLSPIVLSCVGVTLCAAWWIITTRSLQQENSYILAAREIEEHFLSSVLTTVTRGTDFDHGEPVTFQIGGQAVPHEISFGGRQMRSRNTAYVIVYVFWTLHTGVLISQGLPKLVYWIAYYLLWCSHVPS